MTIMNEIDQLTDALEKFIFHKDELREIGKLITQLKEGICTPDKLKTKLLESRVRMLNDIVEFTKFFIVHSNSNDSERIIPQNVQEELEEKNSLLTEIAKRLLIITLETKIDKNNNV
jgi:hypothetical protein